MVDLLPPPQAIAESPIDRDIREKISFIKKEHKQYIAEGGRCSRKQYIPTLKANLQKQGIELCQVPKSQNSTSDEIEHTGVYLVNLGGKKIVVKPRKNLEHVNKAYELAATQAKDFPSFAQALYDSKVQPFSDDTVMVSEFITGKESYHYRLVGPDAPMSYEVPFDLPGASEKSQRDILTSLFSFAKLGRILSDHWQTNYKIDPQADYELKFFDLTNTKPLEYDPTFFKNSREYILLTFLIALAKSPLCPQEISFESDNELTENSVLNHKKFQLAQSLNALIKDQAIEIEGIPATQFELQKAISTYLALSDGNLQVNPNLFDIDFKTDDSRPDDIWNTYTSPDFIDFLKQYQAYIKKEDERIYQTLGEISKILGLENRNKLSAEEARKNLRELGLKPINKTRPVYLNHSEDKDVYVLETGSRKIVIKLEFGGRNRIWLGQEKKVFDILAKNIDAYPGLVNPALDSEGQSFTRSNLLTSEFIKGVETMAENSRNILSSKGMNSNSVEDIVLSLYNLACNGVCPEEVGSRENAIHDYDTGSIRLIDLCYGAVSPSEVDIAKDPKIRYLFFIRNLLDSPLNSLAIYSMPNDNSQIKESFLEAEYKKTFTAIVKLATESSQRLAIPFDIEEFKNALKLYFSVASGNRGIIERAIPEKKARNAFAREVEKSEEADLNPGLCSGKLLSSLKEAFDIQKANC